MSRPAVTPFDDHMMGIALRLACRGLGTTAPNPAVGAVIADPGRSEVVARGWTQPGGRPHAETEAIRRAGGAARGATLYVTLEPCSHHGRTAPCADAVIAAGIGKVVVGIEDPDPRVAGRGLERLRSAGVEVIRGVRAGEARVVTSGHVLRIAERRPMVALKIAASSEGLVPRGDGSGPAWVTGPEARAAGHLLRAEADAILVGRGTLCDDDPELTCRLPGLAGRSPIRIVLSSDPSDLVGTRLLTDAMLPGRPPVWVLTREAHGSSATDALRGARLLGVASVGHRPWLPAAMEQLAAQGVTRLLVEGGPTVWRAFAEHRLLDEVHLFLAGNGAGFGQRDGAPWRPVVEQLLGPLALSVVEARAIGADLYYCLRPQPLALSGDDRRA